MIEFHSIDGTDRADVLIEGDLSASDYDGLRPQLDTFVRTHEAPRLLVEVGDLGDIGIQAIGEDMKLTTDHANDFAKVAFVSEAGWQRAFVSMMGPVSSAEVRGFKRSERRAAEVWLQS